MRWQDCDRLIRFAMCGALALCLLTSMPPDAAGQSDPFRSSRPAARQARPVRAAPHTGLWSPAPPALETRPVRLPPAGYVWALDLRTGCHIALSEELANSGFVQWTGQCVSRLADGPGTLTLIRDGTTYSCHAVLQAGGVLRGDC